MIRKQRDKRKSDLKSERDYLERLAMHSDSSCHQGKAQSFPLVPRTTRDKRTDTTTKSDKGDKSDKGARVHG